jgi:hypothetical protein
MGRELDFEIFEGVGGEDDREKRVGQEKSELRHRTNEKRAVTAVLVSSNEIRAV